MVDLPFEAELSPRHYLRGYAAWKRTADYARYVEMHHATLKSQLTGNKWRSPEEQKTLEDEVAKLAAWITEKAPAFALERALDAKEIEAAARAALAADYEREAAEAEEAKAVTADEDAEQLSRFNYALHLRERGPVHESDWEDFRDWLHDSLGPARTETEFDEQWEAIKTRLNSSSGYKAYDEWVASKEEAEDVLSMADVRKLLEPIESSIRSHGGRVRLTACITDALSLRAASCEPVQALPCYQTPPPKTPPLLFAPPTFRSLPGDDPLGGATHACSESRIQWPTKHVGGQQDGSRKYAAGV